MKAYEKNACPYCGSEDISVDVDIRISCYLENGRVVPHSTNLTEVVEDSQSLEDMSGFCYDCGQCFDVDHFEDDGLVFSILLDGVPAIDKKYCTLSCRSIDL